LAKADIYVGTLKSHNLFENILKKQLNVKQINFIGNMKGFNKGTKHVNLNLKLTPELEAEGYAREISRKIQAFRKKLSLNKKDKIELFVFTDEKFKKILEKQKEFISERINSTKFEISTGKVKETFKNTIDFKIKDKRGTIAIITTKR